ncbi:hypothetical protein HCA61_12915 [Rhodococcus sp. HNM0563]|uniref:hypothetical protein n=1 Tax=Rhodococcus sp. HNM0563 TaxID=2716339 RepID=UPI00146EA72C|nr:hypothetical protein [Rhodococcus sp. HNM0563]NLU63158.1 hypothetical protein [Rhodococcus sp. HNM0563]
MGIAVLVLLGRIRPGYIAIRHDGIRIRSYANDAWIPWDSASPILPSENWKYLTVWLRQNNHATISSLAPWPWLSLGNRAFGYVRSSSPHDRALSVYTDRRIYRIAPEIIDAAVFHYITNPAAREELRDPATIVRTVDTLRTHATTAWWRSQTRTVPVPNLAADTHRFHGA